MSFNELVEDVLSEVASWLDRPRDILNFGLTSSRVWPRVTPVLYANLALRGTECATVLGAFTAQPRLASHVHSLDLTSNEDGMVGDMVMSEAVAELAQHMHALHTFVWNVNVCVQSSMWSRLRIGCPRLVNLGVSFGNTIPRADFPLYDFENLRSFHLILSGLLSRSQDDEPADRWDALWKMLRERCLDLEDLTVDGASEETVTVHHLVDSRWPKLRKLHLGDVATERITPALLDPGSKRRFLQFLESHDNLEDLQLSGKVGMPPASFSAMDRRALPHLKHFGGSIFQISTLRCYHSLRSLHITEPLQLREGIIDGVTQVLSHFRGIQSLRFAFDGREETEQLALLEVVFKACPQLYDLHLRLRGLDPAVRVADLALLFRDLLPMLKTMTLVLAPGSPMVYAMDADAVQLASALPRLRTCSLASLGQSISSRQDRPVPTQFGEYEVVRGPNGRPRELLICNGVRSQKTDLPGEVARPGLRRRFFPYRGWFYYDIVYSTYVFPEAGIPLPRRAPLGQRRRAERRPERRPLTLNWSPWLFLFVAIVLYRTLSG